MTRKDYVALAEAIKDSHADAGEKIKVAESISYALRRDNPRFDRRRFFEACGFIAM